MRLPDPRRLAIYALLGAVAVLAGLLGIGSPSSAVVTGGGDGLVVVQTPGGLVAVNPQSGTRLFVTGSVAGDNNPEVSPNGQLVVFVSSTGTIVQLPFPNGGTRATVAGNQSGCGTPVFTVCGGPAYNASSSVVVFSTASGLSTAPATGEPTGGQATAVTGSFSGDSNPDFSPDGQFIVFNNGAAAAPPPGLGILRVNSNQTGNRTRLNETGPTDTHPRVSPNGQFVIFDNNGASGPGGPCPTGAGSCGVFRMTWPNGQFRSGVNGTAAGDDDPFWSPTGAKIGATTPSGGACPGGGAGSNCMVTFNGDGSGGRVLLLGTVAGDINGAWSIVNAPPPPPAVATTGLMAVESAGGAGPLVAINPGTGARIFLAGSDGGDNTPDVAPNAIRVAFERGGNIFFADYPSGNNRVQVTTRGGFGGGCGGPAWNPTSTVLVFCDPNGLYTAPASANTSATFLNGSSPGDSDPTYDPNGQFIVFDNPAGIFRINANGSGVRTQLLASTTADHPRISPTTSNQCGNSFCIFFDDTSGAAFPCFGNLCRINFIDGGNRTPVAQTFGADGKPFIAPDFSRIGFDNGPGGPGIGVVNGDGSGGRAAPLGTTAGDINGSWAKNIGQPFPSPPPSPPPPPPPGTPGPSATPTGPPNQSACPGHAGDPRPQVVGTNGDDVLAGSPNAVVCGLSGNDILRASSQGGNLLEAGEGIDLICARQGVASDSLDGGPGIDRGRFDEGDTIANIERFAAATFCAT
jgi:Tol biopolymer transport system component